MSTQLLSNFTLKRIKLCISAFTTIRIMIGLARICPRFTSRVQEYDLVQLSIDRKKSPTASAVGDFLLGQIYRVNVMCCNYFISLMAAWAADRRAMGTRKGEQDT